MPAHALAQTTGETVLAAVVITGVFVAFFALIFLFVMWRISRGGRPKGTKTSYHRELTEAEKGYAQQLINKTNQQYRGY